MGRSRCDSEATDQRQRLSPAAEAEAEAEALLVTDDLEEGQARSC